MKSAMKRSAGPPRGKSCSRPSLARQPPSPSASLPSPSTKCAGVRCRAGVGGQHRGRVAGTRSEEDDGRSPPISRRASLASIVVLQAALGETLSESVGSSSSVAQASEGYEIIYDKGTSLQGRTLSTMTDPEIENARGGEIVAKIVVPERWRCEEGAGATSTRTAWTNFRDPVTGDRIIEKAEVAIREYPEATSASFLDDVYKAGTIEAIVGGLPSGTLEGELKWADVFRASKRQDEGGVTYYDWELAASMLTCSDEEKRLLGVCPYKSITLLSVATKAGKLVTLKIDSLVDGYKKYSKDIKSARESFTVVNL